MATEEREPLEVLALRVPRAHAAAVREHAAQLTRITRARVTASAAGSAILEAGLVALGLIPAPTDQPPAVASAPRSTSASSPSSAKRGPKKGAKRTARKP